MLAYSFKGLLVHDSYGRKYGSRQAGGHGAGARAESLYPDLAGNNLLDMSPSNLRAHHNYKPPPTKMYFLLLLKQSTNWDPNLANILVYLSHSLSC